MLQQAMLQQPALAFVRLPIQLQLAVAVPVPVAVAVALAATDTDTAGRGSPGQASAWYCLGAVVAVAAAAAAVAVVLSCCVFYSFIYVFISSCWQLKALRPPFPTSLLWRCVWQLRLPRRRRRRLPNVMSYVCRKLEERKT